MYINKNDTTQECAMRGSIVEHTFENYLLNNRYFFRRATYEEQLQHIDYVVLHKITNQPMFVEVKSTKKINRSDVCGNADFVWVEFKNVNGNPGWLYGQSNYVALYNQSLGSFYLVYTQDLLTLCCKLCYNGYARDASDALYKLYARPNRKDLISLIRWDDLKLIPYKEIK